MGEWVVTSQGRLAGFLEGGYPRVPHMRVYCLRVGDWRGKGVHCGALLYLVIGECRPKLL